MVYLEREDPARNMARFYSIQIQPTLFGDTSLVRCWGRIGTRGQAKMHSFSTEAEAEHLMSDLLRIKSRRGYKVP